MDQEKSKPPRAVSLGASKQVRFDIKEGLKEMIKDSSGQEFNASKIHKELMEKRMSNRMMLQSADDLKLSNQSLSDLQRARVTKASPVFGGSQRGQNSAIRKSTPKKKEAPQLNSSAKRTQQLLSPTNSSQKQAYNMALRYSKEVIEGKVRRGEIDLRKLNKVEAQLDQTPKSNRVLPPKPI